jgi:hypothetical protein
MRDHFGTTAPESDGFPNSAGPVKPVGLTVLFNYVVVGRPAAFQAFKPPAIERTFL